MNEAKKFFIEHWKITSDELLKALIENSSIKTVTKNEMPYKPGDELFDLYFLLDGCYRGFYIDENGNEVTTCIGEKYGYAAMPLTVITDPVTNEYLHVLADSKFICISAGLVRETLEKEPELWRVYNDIVEEVREYHWNIKEAFNGTDASARYEWFKENFPKANESMTNEQICSFLGIAPVTLSRIKNA